jgi:esterase/lipase superfamily enzyme
MWRYWLALVLLLSGCATRPDMAALRPVSAATGTPVAVHVATSRARRSPDANDFTNGRSPRLNLAAYTVSVPPAHQAGRIEWPGREPNPATSFVTVENRVLDMAGFEAGIAARRCAPAAGNTAIFVHGYNTNFPEALFRLVQMTADTEPGGVPILFSWPSDALPLAYIADRDAAIFSRDHLVELLTRVAAMCPGRPVMLVAHSMGGWLTMEALRQLRLMGRNEVIAALRVILASPDIDMDVFRSQVRVIGPLDPPLTVLVSRDDRALSASSRIAGARNRLGNLSVDDEAVQQVARESNIAIVDISAIPASNSLNHDRFVGFARDYSRMIDSGAAEPGGIRRAGAFVFNAIGATVSSPFRLVGRALSPE